MKKQDLLNAIDELDLKYVTQAWEDTQPSTEEYQRLGDKRHGLYAAIGAGIAAVLIFGIVTIAYMRGNARIPIDLLPSNTGIMSESPASEAASDNSDETNENIESNTNVVDNEFLSGELYAPDKETFTYEENDGQCTIIRDGDTSMIVFDNFVYLGTPQNTYNSLTNPNFFVMDSEAFGGMGVVNGAMLKLYKQEVPYKRFYVGDKYGDLTLVSAKTVFNKGNPQLARGKELMSMVAEFDGTTTFPAMIYCYDGVYFAIPMCENIPGGGGNKIPAMSFLETDWDGEYTTSGAHTPLTTNGSVQAYTDVVIRLNNPEEFGLADMVSEKGYATVNLELGDVHIEYNPTSDKRDVDLTTASIVRADPYVNEFNSFNYDKTTDLNSTIESYLRAYISWSGAGHLDDLTLTSVNEITAGVEKIREELTAVNPGESALNPDCAELIHDYEVVYSDGVNNVIVTCRMILDQNNTNVWAVISSQTISSEPIV